jgi:excinuclease UvrABC ATPase subunit
MSKTHKEPCSGCNGTGQMTWFGGVSRFQFSYTDCPECNGVGFLEKSVTISLQSENIGDTGNLSKEKANDFLEALARILSDTLAHGKTVRIRGFGSFSCLSSGSASKTKIRFTPAKQLLEMLNS